MSVHATRYVVGVCVPPMAFGDERGVMDSPSGYPERNGSGCGCARSRNASAPASLTSLWREWLRSTLSETKPAISFFPTLLVVMVTPFCAYFLQHSTGQNVLVFKGDGFLPLKSFFFVFFLSTHSKHK